jgi:DNA-binding CsgD family transcriptional regulator
MEQIFQAIRSELLFARDDQGKYDEPAPSFSRAKDDLNGLHYILRNHFDGPSQTQREIILATYFEGQSRDEIAARRGISLNTHDSHRKAACSRLRDSMIAVVDFSTDIDLPDWYDRIEEMSRRYASGKKEKRSSSGGDRSNFEDDRSNSRRDRDKHARARDRSIVVGTES